LTRVSCAEVLLKMQSGDVPFAKQVRVLSRYEMQQVLMGSDSNKFFRNNSSALPYTDITAFVGTLKNVCFLLHKMLFVSQVYLA